MPGGRSRYALPWEIDEIKPWVLGKKPGKTTNPLEAIKETFEGINPDTIWILTDGRFNCPGGGRAVRELISNLNTDQSARVNTVGFHRRPESVDSVLGQIAHDNNGTFYFSRSGNRPPPKQ